MAQTIDLNDLISQANAKINEFIKKAEVYFKSLTQFELYAWIGNGVGFILVLIALITW